MYLQISSTSTYVQVPSVPLVHVLIITTELFCNISQFEIHKKEWLLSINPVLNAIRHCKIFSKIAFHNFYILTLEMGNFTQEKEIIYQPEIDDFEHPLHIKITLCFISILTVVTLIVINRRLFIFLRRPNRRILDQIVDFQYTINQVIAVLTIIFFNIIIWTKVAKPYVTEVGCYIGSYIFYFLAPYANAHSFFIALFRYICIIHPNKLSKFGLSPEVRCLFFLI